MTAQRGPVAPPSPPGPPGRFLSGNLEAYERDRLGFLLAARDQYGPVVRFDGRTTIVNDASLARQVLHDAGTFVISQNFLVEDIPAGEADAWLTVRRLLNPGLRRANAEAHASRLVRLLDSVLEQAVATGPIPAMGLMERVMSRTIADFYFHDDNPELALAAARLLDALAGVVGNPFALPAWLPTPTRLLIRRRFGDLQQLMAPLVQERVRSQGRHEDYVTGITSKLSDRDVSDPHFVERLVRTLIGAMLAAHRVPAAAACWLLNLAHTDDSVWPELVREGQLLRSRLVTGGDFQAADYPVVRAAAHESLRLYPATWLISRQVFAPVQLGGYTLTPRHQVLISPYVLHRNPAVFPDPGSFQPARWQAATRDMRASYLPFGAGPRACPGSHLAMTTLLVSVLAIASGWQIELETSTVRPDPRTTLLPRGLQVQVLASNESATRVLGYEATPSSPA